LRGLTRVIGLVRVFFAFFEFGGEVLGFFFGGLVALVAGAFGANGADTGHFGGWGDGIEFSLVGVVSGCLRLG
jgi:hypothetical protein